MLRIVFFFFFPGMKGMVESLLRRKTGWYVDKSVIVISVS